MLPDFLIIGAAKSATSWLAQCMRESPAFFVPPAEIHYFARYHERPLSWYEDHFKDAKPGQLIGEKSNTYLSDPAAAARIKEILPKAKLIAVLRNPIARAYSAYCMQLDRGKVSDRIEQHMDPDRTTVPHTLTDGLYHRLLQNFFSIYPREALHITTYEDLMRDPAEIARVGAFLRLADPALMQPIKRKVNAKKENGAPRWLKRMIWPIVQSEPVRIKVMDAAKRTGLSGAVIKMTGKRLSYPEVPESIRDKLRSYYAADVSALSNHLGRDFSHWLTRD